MSVIQRFESKKNKVLKVRMEDNYYIRKEYADYSRMAKEFEILKHMDTRGANIPKPYKMESNTIHMAFIDGILLLDYYTELEKRQEDEYEDFIHKLAQAHLNIYLSLNFFDKNMILKDMNFRNYLISNDVIYRIDFEDCEQGNIAGDIGKLAAFALTYNPVKTAWKKKFTNRLIRIFSETFKIQIEQISYEMNKELELIKARRK